MAFVYILQGTTGRYYIGATEHLESRLLRHNSGRVHSSKRLGLPLKLIATEEFRTMQEALSSERKYKTWKNPKKVIESMLRA